MNSLERVRLTLQHKEADHVPVYPLINSISRNYTGIDYATWSQNTELCAQSIIKATDQLNVGDYSNFYRVFRKIVGTSPSKYVKR